MQQSLDMPKRNGAPADIGAGRAGPQSAVRLDANSGSRSGAAKTLPQTLSNERDVSQAAAYLTKRCEALRHARRIAGAPPLRRHPEGFAGLARIIVGQQLSTSAALAIHNRLNALNGAVTPGLFLNTPPEILRAAGLSRAKIDTLTRVALEIEAGRLNLTVTPDGTGRIPDEALAGIRRRLLAQRGIGPWTADIYEMFCLGHADAFAAGDLALREAARRAFRLESRPDPVAILEFAERWRPVRSVAAALLWAYYATGDRK